MQALTALPKTATTSLQKRLVVHIGLPKTATTSLQTYFFPRSGGYLGKFHPDSPADESHEALDTVDTGLSSALVQIAKLYYGGQKWQEALAGWVARLDFSPHPVCLISNEVLSKWYLSPEEGAVGWPDESPGPGTAPRRGAHPVTAFLAKLRDFLPPDVSLSTIVTFRNQTDWLGSLFAQGGAIESVPNHSRVYQLGADFTRIIQNEDSFLDFYCLATELEKVSGPSQHLTLIFEDGVAHNARRIEEFTGLSFLVVAEDLTSPKKANSRRVDMATWRAGWREKGSRSNWELASSAAFRNRVHLPSGLRRWIHPCSQFLGRLLERAMRSTSRYEQIVVAVSSQARRQMWGYCAPRNKLLAQHLKRDLTALGY